MKLFSEHIPDCRLVWDATALSAFSRDPFTYILTCNLGYRSTTPRPEWIFGQIYNEFIQTLLIKNGQGADELVKYYINKAKHQHLNELCSPTELPTKGLDALQQTLEERTGWMFIRDFFSEYKLISLCNVEGIEVDFLWELPLKNSAQESYYLAGYWDALLTDGEDLFPHEIKTARKDTFEGYLEYKLYPSIQFRTYELVAREQFKLYGMKYKGILADVCSLYKTKSPQFNLRKLSHPDYVIDWWLVQVQRIIQRAEQMARENLLSIESLFSLCPEANPEGMIRYRTETNPEPTYDIFNMSPAQRFNLLEEFIQNPQPWDPTIKRNLTYED